MNPLTLGLERASLVGVAALLVAWLAQKFLDNRVPASWRVWIWRVALLQTALALLPLSPVSLAVLPSISSPAPAPTEGKDISGKLEPVPPVYSKTTLAKSSTVTADVTMPSTIGSTATGDVDSPSESSQFEVFKLWCYWNQDKIWLAVQGLYILGIGFQLIKLGRSSRRLRRVLRSGGRVEDEDLNCELRAVARRMSVTSLPRLIQVQGGAPFLVGIIRPRIVMPKGSELQQGESEAVLWHELAHLKRRDLAWNLLAWSVQTVLWFHPLAWASRYYLPLETESACDEMVLASSRISPALYGNLLLNTLSAERTPLTAGVTDGFAALKTRLLRLNYAPRHPKRMGKIIFACGLALAIASVLPVRLISRSQAAPNTRATTARPESARKMELITKTGIVQGRVLTPDGKPVKGARISWISYNSSLAEGRESILGTIQSDAQGHFRFDNSKDLLEKSLNFVGPTQQVASPQLLVEAQGWGCATARIALQEPTSYTLHLTRPTELQTTFLDPQGEPSANLAVHLSFIFWEKPGSETFNRNYVHLGQLKHFQGVTDAKGVLRLTGLPQGGRARLEIDDERFAQLEFKTAEVDLARQAQTTTTAPIRLETGATLRGRIIYGDSGKPVAGVRVGAQGQDPTNGWGEAVSDGDGYYRIFMLRAGRYNLALDLDDKISAQWTARAREGVSVVTGAQQVNLDFALEHGVLITGKVVAQGTEEPVEGAMIGIYGPAHPKSSAWVQGATSRSDGSYQLRVPAGSQYIYISGVPEGFVRPESQPISTVDLGTKHNTPYEFTAEDGQDEIIDWGLKALPPALDVQVRVLDANGQPAKGAQVELIAVNDEEASPEGDSNKRTTDAQGRTIIPNVRGAIQVWARLGSNATPQAREVLGGQSVTLKLQPDALVELKGTVVDDTGKPLPGIKVDLLRWKQRSGRVSQSVVSDAQGHYSFGELWPDATYSLMAQAAGYAQGEIERFQLKPGETHEMKEFVLSRTTSFIAGRVVDTTEKAVAGATVWVSGKKTGSVQAKTDEKGDFRLDAIVPNDELRLIATLDKSFGTANARAGSTETVIVIKKR